MIDAATRLQRWFRCRSARVVAPQAGSVESDEKLDFYIGGDAEMDLYELDWATFASNAIVEAVTSQRSGRSASKIISLEVLPCLSLDGLERKAVAAVGGVEHGGFEHDDFE